MRILKDIRWRQLLASWKCLAFKEIRIINLDLSCLGQFFFFFYKDIVLNMWNYKESSGTVSFQAGEVCTAQTNAEERGTLQCHERFFKILWESLGWGTGRSSEVVDPLQVWCLSASLLQSVI